MKRRFTKLMAALALLTFLAVPLGMWGQTRAEGDVHDMGITQSTLLNNNAAIPSITIPAQSYPVKAVIINWRYNKATANVVTINVSVNGNSWGSQSVGTNTTADAIFEGTATTGEIIISFTNHAGSGTGKGTFYVNSVKLTEGASSTYTITPESNNASYGSVSLSGTTITATPNSGYRVIAGNGGYTVTAGTATVTNNGDNTFSITPESDCTVQINFEAIPTHTITFYAGSGTCNTPSMSGLDGSTITLPTAEPSAACASRGWEFAGWATTGVSETTNAPTLLNGDYTITADADLYAVYKVTEGDGGTTEFDFAIIANANDWGNGVAYTEVTIAPVTIVAQGGGNNGKWYTSGGGSWRIYSGGTVSVSAGDKAVTNVESLPECDFNISNGIATFSPSDRTDFTSITVTYGTSTTTYNSNPSCLPMVATPTFTPAAGTYTGAQNVTIECDTDGATIQYKTTEEGEWQNYSEAIPVSTTTTIWAKATNNGMDDSEVAEATYVIQYTLTVNIEDMVEYSLFDNSNETWDEITLDENGQALVSSGADIRISGGEVYDDCYEVESFDVTDGNDDPVTVVDNTDEDGTYSFIMPASNATLTATLNEIADHYTLTVEGTANVSFEMLVGSMSTITPLNANHQASICEASEVKISELTATTGHVLESVTLTYGGQTTVITPTSGVYEFSMPSSDATLTITVGDIPTYSLITSVDQLVSGKHYIIASGTNGSVKAMGTQNTNNRAAVAVQSANGVIPETADVFEFVIIGPDVNGHYTIYDVANEKYLNAAGTGSSNNYLKLQDPIDDRGLWEISFSNQAAIINAITTATDRTIMRYNSGNTVFSCYGSGQNPIYLYAKDNEATVSYTLDITSYEIAQQTYGEEKGGYYLIASPVGQVNPTAANGFLTNSYDLYAFNDSFEEAEWRNYEETAFNLVSGRGYLYANNGNEVTLSFEGVPYVGNGQVFLSYTEDKPFIGWNLIGNPFNNRATLSVPYYRLNDEGSALNTETESTEVNVMEGVFVKATNANQSVTFTKAAAKRVSQLNVKVACNRGAVLDNAIIRFDNGAVLGKFQLNPKHTKVYFQQDNKDYAVVRSANEGEMPVNFKAETRGTYTLSVNTENVEMSYLHLIDNKTGADVDLLQTPSYTFEAKTSDYASRFRLVFSANSVASEGACEPGFAYFNGSSWTISNMGEATLQVVDVMGRVLSSETLSGNAEVNINQPTGVYMLRLVSGDSVKVQKVVVR